MVFVMPKNKEEKTNVMRLLEQKKIAYTPHTYPHGEGDPVDGASVAAELGQDPGHVFKTLVTRGASGGFYVFDVPVLDNLDLKKAARAVGEKSVAMIAQKELLPLTGYIHGGCSPVGMKKQFPTVFHETATDYDTILVSAGKIGYQTEVKPGDLLALLRAQTADITVKD
jgi:Cys-tRNA(Pro)/Cys-tRNA(Cys) deacylase